MAVFSLRSFLQESSLQRVASLTLFLSAFLLLGVQPMLGRMVLPFVGGSPAGWLMVLILLQVTLAAAYGYSALLTRHTSPTTQLYLHFSLIIAAFLSLPLAIRVPSDNSSLLWFVAYYVLSIGLPLFVNAANAPLLQQWFSGTSHPRAKDPYFLYVASNAGSVTALLSYVLIIEPHLTLQQQSQWWSLAFVVLASMVAFFGIWTTRLRTNSTTSLPSSQSRPAPPPWRARLTWCLLAFVPSSLLHATTLHITSTLTAAPLLWVLPLLVYFLTFALCFARRAWLSSRVIHASHSVAIVLYGLFLIVFATPPDILFSLGLVLLVLFTSALICHAKLNRKRPTTQHLGSFYLWLAIGIALGGLFNALLAPLFFDELIEYPLMLALACLLRSKVTRVPHRYRHLMDFVIPLVLLAVLYIAQAYSGWLAKGFALLPILLPVSALWLWLLAVPVLVFLSLVMARRPVRFALCAVALFVVASGHDSGNESGNAPLLQWRNIFGIYRLTVEPAPTGTIHTLYRGVTLQDMQVRTPQHEKTPVAYFHPKSPLGDVIDGTTQTATSLADSDVGSGYRLCCVLPQVRR